MPGNIKTSQLDLVGLSGHIVDVAATGTYYPLTKTSWSNANPSGFLTIEDGSWQIHSGHLVGLTTGASGELSGRLATTGDSLTSDITSFSGTFEYSGQSMSGTFREDVDSITTAFTNTSGFFIQSGSWYHTGSGIFPDPIGLGEGGVTLTGALAYAASGVNEGLHRLFLARSGEWVGIVTDHDLSTGINSASGDISTRLESTGTTLNTEVNQISSLDKTFAGDKTFTNKIIVKDKINLSAIDLNLNVDDSVSFDKSDGAILTLGQSYTSEYGRCILSATDAAGLPLFEVYEDDMIIIGRYSKNTVVVSGETVTMNLPSYTTSASTGTLSRGTLFRSGDHVRIV
jgi:hypothetical protein